MSGNPFESPTIDSCSPPERSSGKRKRLSLGVLVVAVNFALWQVGVFLDSFGGWLDLLGARICETTYGLAWVLIPTTVVYCFVRRFVLSLRQWDLYGPALAVIFVLIMYWQLEMNARM